MVVPAALSTGMKGFVPTGIVAVTMGSAVGTDAAPAGGAAETSDSVSAARSAPSPPRNKAGTQLCTRDSVAAVRHVARITDIPYVQTRSRNMLREVRTTAPSSRVKHTNERGSK